MSRFATRVWRSRLRVQVKVAGAGSVKGNKNHQI